MGNLNPYYNESFVFIVEQEQLRVIFLHVSNVFIMRNTECLLSSYTKPNFLFISTIFHL